MKLLHTAHVPTGEGPFPTVLALHGWGASAHDLLGLAPLLQGGQALVLCPQGRVEVPIGPGVKGYGWFPINPGQPPDTEAFRAAAQELRDFVAEAAERYPLDRRQLVVLGFSQGGALAYELGLREPERYAGLAALSTWLPPPLVESLPKKAEHAELPVLVIHGRQDPLVDVERARESRESLRSFEVPLMYREFDMAHEIRPEAMEVLLHWLAEKALGQP